MARVSVRDFSFRYRKEQPLILRDLNLDFSTEERILILGPSGGGKSTLLLTLLRLYTAFDVYYDRGGIYYDDRPGEELSRKDMLKFFGVVFQSPSHQFCLQYPEDEAAFGLENLQIDPSKMQDIIDRSFLRFGFRKKNLPIQTLSGGEQQILAAASTTLLESRMLVMDEPTAHLDPPGRKRFRSSLESWLTGERGFLLVEHHIDLWLDLIQRVVVLDEKGRILFDEKGTEVLTREKSLLSQMGVWLPRERNFVNGMTLNGLSPFREVAPVSVPALEFRNAGIGYGDNSIIHELDFLVGKGEMVALIGKNGCGKSTLLQSLIGLSQLHRGDILLDGDSYRIPKKILRMKDAPAYLFQNPEHQFIYPTVQEEVRKASLSSANAKDTEFSLLEKLRLSEKRHQNPFTLSGGEKRRLSLVSILTGDHSLYLLDEPTFGQDAKTARELVQLIKELHEEGKTIVMVSHDLPLFYGLLNRVVVLYKGGIVFDGSPSDLSECTPDQLNLWGVDTP